MNSDQPVTTSPQVYAKFGGLFYLIIIVAGLFTEGFIKDKLIVSGDPSATAAHIMASEHLWRIGIIGNLIMHISDVPLMLIFYVLLRPVSRNLALLAVLFNLVSTAVIVANDLNLLTPLFLLGGADYLKAFESNQLNALAYLSLKSNDFGYGIGLIFFGCECLVLGYLIFKSDYLPKTIGILMQIAGSCYLVNSFALLIAPAFANMLFPAILVPSFIGESSFCVWLIVKGVNVPKWKQRLSPI
jgi:hypothetical protein